MSLLEPLLLGRKARAPSRVMFGPHETNLARRPSDRGSARLMSRPSR